MKPLQKLNQITSFLSSVAEQKSVAENPGTMKVGETLQSIISLLNEYDRRISDLESEISKLKGQVEEDEK